MPATKYQVTLGDRVVQVQVRREGDQWFARIDAGDEQPVQLTTLHGALRSLAVGERRVELLAARFRDQQAAVAGSALQETALVFALGLVLVAASVSTYLWFTTS